MRGRPNPQGTLICSGMCVACSRATLSHLSFSVYEFHINRTTQTRLLSLCAPSNALPSPSLPAPHPATSPTPRTEPPMRIWTRHGGTLGLRHKNRAGTQQRPPTTASSVQPMLPLVEISPNHNPALTARLKPTPPLGHYTKKKSA